MDHFGRDIPVPRCPECKSCTARLVNSWTAVGATGGGIVSTGGTGTSAGFVGAGNVSSDGSGTSIGFVVVAVVVVTMRQKLRMSGCVAGPLVRGGPRFRHCRQHKQLEHDLPSCRQWQGLFVFPLAGMHSECREHWQHASPWRFGRLEEEGVSA